MARWQSGNILAECVTCPIPGTRTAEGCGDRAIMNRLFAPCRGHQAERQKRPSEPSKELLSKQAQEILTEGIK